MHSGKEVPTHHVNDVSVPGSAARAKQYLPFLQRGPVHAVVEHVLSGHRLKVSWTHVLVHLRTHVVEM